MNSTELKPACIVSVCHHHIKKTYIHDSDANDKEEESILQPETEIYHNYVYCATNAYVRSTYIICEIVHSNPLKVYM